mmetsp:Transcript_67893/g.189594  ORF Transcript_67893/g.189594 Transcript_67893/m.189594 type:complete len:99 (-) Transcript_67893:71-367(-)
MRHIAHRTLVVQKAGQTWNVVVHQKCISVEVAVAPCRSGTSVPHKDRANADCVRVEVRCILRTERLRPTQCPGCILEYCRHSAKTSPTLGHEDQQWHF